MCKPGSGDSRYMKIYITLFLAFFLSYTSYGQQATIVIKGIKFFTVREAIKTEYEKKDTLLKLYRLINGKRQYILQHYLYRTGADAENEFEDVGSIQISNDSIILKTHYFQKGTDPIPEWRKIIYRVTAAGKIRLLYNKCRYKNSQTWIACSD